MELNKAIQKAVQDNGTDKVKERFFALMLDYQAFEDNKLAKIVLSQLDKKGYMPQIIDLFIQKDVFRINSIKNSIAEDFAFDKKVVSDIFEEFNKAFGLKTTKEDKKDENNTSSTKIGTINVYDISVVNYNKYGNIVNKEVFSSNEINCLVPKVNLVSTFQANETINFVIKIINNGKIYTSVSHTKVTAGQNMGLMLNNNINGILFQPGKCCFEIYLDGKILASKTITIQLSINQNNSSLDTILNDETVKIIATISATLFNFIVAELSFGVLIITLPATICACVTLFDPHYYNKTMKHWWSYALLILLFITLFSPMPFLLILIEFIGVLVTSSLISLIKYIFKS